MAMTVYLILRKKLIIGGYKILHKLAQLRPDRVLHKVMDSLKNG